MPLEFNLRHLETKSLRLRGEIAAAELDLDARDELIQMPEPLRYDLELQQMEDAVLAQGRLEMTLHCECGRCLKPFQYRLELKDWACHIPLEGEDKVSIANDCVDLTPYLREDIFLALPQHPRCNAECKGLTKPAAHDKKTEPSEPPAPASSEWAKLDKLKL